MPDLSCTACTGVVPYKKNPLKNTAVMLRLNPFAQSMKRNAMLDQENHTLAKETKKHAFSKKDKRMIKEHLDEIHEKREAIKKEKREAVKKQMPVVRKKVVKQAVSAPKIVAVVHEPEPVVHEQEIDEEPKPVANDERQPVIVAVEPEITEEVEIVENKSKIVAEEYEIVPIEPEVVAHQDPLSVFAEREPVVKGQEIDEEPEHVAVEVPSESETAVEAELTVVVDFMDFCSPAGDDSDDEEEGEESTAIVADEPETLSEEPELVVVESEPAEVVDFMDFCSPAGDDSDDEEEGESPAIVADEPETSEESELVVVESGSVVENVVVDEVPECVVEKPEITDEPEIVDNEPEVVAEEFEIVPMEQEVGEDLDVASDSDNEEPDEVENLFDFKLEDIGGQKNKGFLDTLLNGIEVRNDDNEGNLSSCNESDEDSDGSSDDKE